MTHNEKQDWDQLAQDAETGAMTPDPNTPSLHGDDAAEAGRAILREVYGTDDLDAISDADLRRGRPSLSAQKTRAAGESPMLRVRVPAQVDEAISSLSQAQGRTKSELIRDWIEEGLRQAS
ncbi:ribbon-helix-helix protein, CopG family [Kocuria sp. TGY1127_2]|uniref:ribbon-helix-helix protein, CopG family n=1 Tax=Kocuria sp. TGY1127_2 TaxID=2711328 RepID=UPI0015B972D8|nr:ribbon-helix-helix protein, CopG family [Kocuria sp. TGY1127_2]